MTLLTNIENHAHKNADRIAIKIDKQQITYKALKDETPVASDNQSHMVLH